MRMNGKNIDWTKTILRNLLWGLFIWYFVEINIYLTTLEEPLKSLGLMIVIVNFMGLLILIGLPKIYSRVKK